MRSIAVIAHNIRSTHNVGSILRTADGFGVEEIYFTGITPYPATENDTRLPHISKKLTEQINKTALGAVATTKWSHNQDVIKLVDDLKQQGYRIIGLEQAKDSIPLSKYTPAEKCALILGNEVSGINKELLATCDDIVEIIMYGHKESFNVVQATAVALYALREA